MTYFRDLHTYLHQSSLLIQAYPQDTKITTKYSLPRKSKQSKGNTTATEPETEAASRQKRDPSATLTLKTYNPATGICLKYKTDKAAEVGRLMTGLGRLAKGESIDMPTAENAENVAGAEQSAGGPNQSNKMDIDTPSVSETKNATQMAQSQQQPAGGKKKKKNKK